MSTVTERVRRTPRHRKKGGGISPILRREDPASAGAPQQKIGAYRTAPWRGRSMTRDYREIRKPPAPSGLICQVVISPSLYLAVEGPTT